MRHSTWMFWVTWVFGIGIIAAGLVLEGGMALWVALGVLLAGGLARWIQDRRIELAAYRRKLAETTHAGSPYQPERRP